jgi:hypothetical protein
VVWIDQLVPFQRSTNPSPTAVQAVADGHDTPLSWLTGWPVGLGEDWIDQVLPFQRSAKVPWLLPPTAVQATAEVHDTPSKKLYVALVGFGVDWTDQLVPSQRSAKVSALPLFVDKKDPTAVHAVVDVHDTPLSWLFTAALGMGIV